MRSLNLPTYSFKIKSEGDRNYIFDPYRKKYLLLTPEEWVRQNFASFLINEKDYPSGRIITEKTLKYNQLTKRCDILIYDRNLNPLALIECKAPEVKITGSVFDQIAVYNLNFKVRYLMVTNGLSHYCARINFTKKTVEFMKEIPLYNQIQMD